MPPWGPAPVPPGGAAPPGPAWRLVAALCLGALLGAGGASLGAGRTVQRLRLERDQALAELDATRKELRALQESVRTQGRGPRVQEVAVRVFDAPDDRVRVEMQRRLERELTGLVGRRLEELDPAPVVWRLQRATWEVDGRMYRAEVLTVAIWTRLALNVRIAPAPAPGPG
ncbi:MAG: hypothetical protein L6E13_04330 [Firmicutes bacterium]|nr:hypothetical protein [Bacillota bacterium]